MTSLAELENKPDVIAYRAALEKACADAPLCVHWPDFNPEPSTLPPGAHDAFDVYNRILVWLERPANQ